jgi:Zn-dependent peptidase ImmA (M78 family)
MEFEASPSSDEIVRVLLDITGTDRPPTVPERIAEYLELRIVYFDNHDEYELNSRIRAFLWPKKKLIGVHAGLMRVQQRFSILHEIGHYVLPGHLETLGEGGKFEDDVGNFRATSTTKTLIQKEIEANQFAADCLFQQSRFESFINTSEVNWMNIINAADLFGASIEATARRWIEKTKEEHALVVFRPSANTAQESPQLEIFYTVTSPSFKYFSSLKAGQLMNRDSIVHSLFYDKYGGPQNVSPEEALAVRLAGQIVDFRMQLFTNRYRVFGILTLLGNGDF